VIVAPVITILGVVPNFVLVVVIITAMRNSPLRSTIFGFALGLLFDFFSLGPMGSMTLVLTILSYAVSSLNKGAFSGGMVVDTVILLAAVALGELLVSVIYAIVGVNPEFLFSLVQRVLPGILYDVIIGFIILLIYSAFVGNRPSRPNIYSGRSLSRKLNR
jgi:rod shape-determining protein MreD